MLTSIELRLMQEGKNYRCLDKVYPFMASFTRRSAEYDWKAPMTRFHIGYSESAVDVLEICDRALGAGDSSVTH